MCVCACVRARVCLCWFSEKRETDGRERRENVGEREKERVRNRKRECVGRERVRERVSKRARGPDLAEKE